MLDFQKYGFCAAVAQTGEAVTFVPVDGAEQDGLKALIRRGVERVGEYGSSTVFAAEVAILMDDLDQKPVIGDQVVVECTHESFQIALAPIHNGVFYRLLVN